jgi:hypothetical protein
MMELYCTPKSQHPAVEHIQQLFEHTYTSNLYGLGTNSNRICPTGTLLVLLQHEVAFKNQSNPADNKTRYCENQLLLVYIVARQCN